MKGVLIVISILHSLLIFAQNPLPPCGDYYGSAADESNIIQQMHFGGIQDAQNAIEQAKNTRGFALGCPQATFTYAAADFTQPTLNDVAAVWNSVHKPTIESYSIDCPRIARYENNAALGAYYANLAGYTVNLAALEAIGDMMEAQQYSANTVSIPDSLHTGFFAYLHVPSNDPCYVGGVVGTTVDQFCANIPSLCVDYETGLFAGQNFLIGDIYEPLNIYDGGGAYDHGWAGVQMIEAAIQQNDPVVKAKFKNSVVLAVEWAIKEPCVKNHNYTAKLIWLLAQMYLWSGDQKYANQLNYKLDKNLLPSVLMDQSPADGFVDGTNPPIAFADLTTVAQLPGRCWDGHNSLPWYNGMNAWAITEAYVAFRDRGDTNRANELRPYVIAMLDNLAWEVNNLGVFPNQLGTRDFTYALLIGIWKVAQYENETHQDWENAVWAMWNTGYYGSFGTQTVCVGLYLCILANTPYIPLYDREDFTEISNFTPNNELNIFPNPANEIVTIDLNDLFELNMKLRIVDANGKECLDKKIKSKTVEIDVSKVPSGSYVVEIWSQHKVLDKEILIIQH